MDCTHWYHLCLAILGAFTLLFIMHLGYSLTLGKRTAKLEKKNGSELNQIDKLNKKVNKLEKRLKKYE